MSDSDIKEKIIQVVPLENAVIRLLTKAHLAFLEGEHTPTTNGNSADWQKISPSYYEDTHPKEITFLWTSSVLSADGYFSSKMEFCIELSFTPDFREIVRQTPVHTAHMARLTNLEAGKKYYWRVKYFLPDDAVGYSTVRSFFTEARAPRWINIPELPNVRDIGAWKTVHADTCVRQGCVYRGSAFNRSCKLTVKGKGVLLNELKIKTEIDMRSRSEAGSPLKGQNIVYLNLPTGAYGQFFNTQYQESVKKIFELLADTDNYPIYLHCEGGADRTGVICYLLNALLGVSDEDLLTDFELTSFSIWEPRSRYSTNMQNFLEMLRTYGTIKDSSCRLAENYLATIGVAPETIATLQKNLTE